MPLTESQTRYVNFYTDFAFKRFRLFEQAEIAMFTPQERISYEESLKDYRDIYSVMKTQRDKGHEEGRKEGRKEGREEGREEERVKNAKGFKAKGIDINIISEVTGLSKEEIEKL